MHAYIKCLFVKLLGFKVHMIQRRRSRGERLKEWLAPHLAHARETLAFAMLCISVPAAQSPEVA